MEHLTGARKALQDLITTVSNALDAEHLEDDIPEELKPELKDLRERCKQLYKDTGALVSKWEARVDQGSD